LYTYYPKPDTSINCSGSTLRIQVKTAKSKGCGVDIYTRQKSEKMHTEESHHADDKPRDQLGDIAAGKVITVIIADDHTLFREGIKAALAHKKDIKIVGEAENGLQLLHMLKHNIPDIVLLDIQMPLMDGITALSTIRKLNNKDLKIIMLSMHNESSIVSLLMATGANAYLNKTADPESIYQAIKTCYAKSYYFNELTNMSMLEKIRTAGNVQEIYTEPKIRDLNSVKKLPEIPIKVDRKKSGGARYIIAAGGFVLLITTCIVAYSFLHITPLEIEPTYDKKLMADTDTLHKIELAKTVAPVLKVVDTVASNEDSIYSKNIDSSSVKEKPALLNTPDSSLHKKRIQGLNSQNSTLSENNEKTPDNKKNEATKINNVKKQKIDSSKTTGPVSKPELFKKNDSTVHKQESSEAVSDYIMKVKENIASLVRLTAFEGKAGSIDRELFAQLKINNRTTFRIDTVIVEVRYLSEDSAVYKSENLIFHNIGPFTSAVQQTQVYKKGENIKSRIISVKSKELDLY
jgi:DNA-binding NarL/FixJ family response regulator